MHRATGKIDDKRHQQGGDQWMFGGTVDSFDQAISYDAFAGLCRYRADVWRTKSCFSSNPTETIFFTKPQTILQASSF